LFYQAGEVPDRWDVRDDRTSKKNGSPIKRRKVASKPTIESEDESDPIIVSKLRIPRPKESDGASTTRALWALVDKVKGPLGHKEGRACGAQGDPQESGKAEAAFWPPSPGSAP